jgi:predicted RNase H-like nuclease (RuvC/YqgF family)
VGLSEQIDEQRVIMGIDLAPSAQHMQEYALVVINEKGTIIDRREGVDWRTVSCLLKKYKVDTIAVDNVFEIGESISEIKKRLGKVVDKVRLVEVTRVGNHYVKLTELAFREGILSERFSHLSPLQAAEALALLALKGIGTAIIEPSTIRTAILISRGRSLGQGGMSQGRYNRSQRSAIRQVTSIILDELKKHVDGSDVECYVQRSKFGLERSVIILNTTPSHVKKLLKPLRDLIKKSGVNLKIIAKIPAFDERQVDIDHRGGEKPVIVGLDPGIITGVAVLDLHGTLLFVDSGLALDKMSIIRIATRFGNPVVIASDVRRAPVVVEKIASILGCTVYTPPRDLSVEEKRRVVQENVINFKDLIKNSHQRDAVAAALKAYFNFKNKFVQLEAKAKELNLSRPQIEKAKALVVKGFTIKEALARVTLDDKPDKPPVMTQAEPEIQRLRFELSRLREKIEEQSKTIKDLEESRLSLLRQLKEKEAKIEELEEALIKASLKSSHVLQDEVVKRRLEASAKTIAELKTRLEVMERDLEELKRLVRELARGNVMIVKEVRSITKRSLEEVMKYEVLRKGEILLVQDPTSSNVEGIEHLIKMQPEAIITKIDKMPKEVLEAFKENCIPVIDVEEVKVEKASDFLYVPSTIKELIKAKKEQLVVERDRSLKEMLRDMLQKYREERARELERLKR